MQNKNVSSESRRREGVPAEVVGTRFGLNAETIRRWAREGRIPAYKAGVVWRFDLDEVEAALRADEQGE